ncbi:hypothetical protein [Streptomyces luteogriseus]|uniref:Proteasome lid subunit RPN8/RPN11 n=1 Tax=Streptomyces luteogriseus TaxID=68233 RepID=A0A7W7DVI3_9ACTN|nr:hypothetical protein [Streptomyces luteogriseus]MBB4716745.1 proteasome lid subunit RPN8/RPN11 [Streptomyces luteogriseus]
MTSAHPHTVLIGFDFLKSFTSAARTEYEECTPEEPPSCFALLLGTIEGGVAHIAEVEFATNARASDPTAVAEFSGTIAACFGAAYRNTRRGFWCSSKDLLRIQRQAEHQGLDILGSVHMHPDWHRIGPPSERGLTISEDPTPMDRYMFDNTRYPVNMICYLESIGGKLSSALAAWGPPSEEQADAPCPRLALRFAVD